MRLTQASANLFAIAAFLIGGQNLCAQIQAYEIKPGHVIGTDSLHSLLLQSSLKLNRPGKEMQALIKASYQKGDSLIYEIDFEIIFSENRANDSMIVFSKQFHWLGRPFPFKELQSLEGHKLNLQGGTAPTFINCWFSACKPCLAELAFLNQMEEHYRGQLNFVGLNFENAERVEQFLAEHTFPFQQVAEAQEILDRLAIEAFPLSILLNAEGKIIAIFGPFSADDTLQKPKSEAAQKLQRLLISELKNPKP